MWLLDKLLTKVIRNGRLEVTDHDGKHYAYGSGEEPPIRLRFTHPKAARHIARYPQLGAGEAYMRGWLVIEPPHDVRDLVLFFTSQAKSAGGERVLKPQGTVSRLTQMAVAKADSINLPGKAKRNAKHTYNMTRRLYELFLDEDRQYTMAYWRGDPEATTLEKAQLDKKALIAAKLYMQHSSEFGRPMKVLDIGCGWGGLALYLNKHYDCEVLGIALAEDQIAFCRERAKALGVDDKVRFELLDYREVEGQFDRITSIGMIEHVGTPHFPQYFGKTYDLLANDGVSFLHTCGRVGPPGYTDAWTRKYIFPGGYIPALSELVVESEKAGWQVMDVEAMRFHYSYTLAEWYRRTCLHEEEIVAMYDEQFFRMWQFYLAGAEQSFRHGTMVNWQIQFVKDRAALPMTRDYMEIEAKRLRESEEPPQWHLDPALQQAAE